MNTPDLIESMNKSERVNSEVWNHSKQTSPNMPTAITCRQSTTIIYDEQYEAADLCLIKTTLARNMHVSFTV